MVSTWLNYLYCPHCAPKRQFNIHGNLWVQQRQKQEEAAGTGLGTEVEYREEVEDDAMAEAAQIDQLREPGDE